MYAMEYYSVMKRNEIVQYTECGFLKALTC